MTPFGIRKKLKSLLNPDGGRSEIVRHTITLLLPDGVEKVLTTEEHYSILMAADASGITISTGRRAGGTCPDGHCGLCRLEVLDQTGLSVMKSGEKESLEDHAAGRPHEGRPREPGPPLTPNTRLGCHAKVLGSGARIQVPALFTMEDIKGAEGAG